jgi:hypothetical protein
VNSNSAIAPAEHREVDRPARLDVGEVSREERAIRRRRIQPCQQRLTNRLVAEAAPIRRRDALANTIVELVEGRANCSRGTGEPRDLDELGRRDVCLRGEQRLDHRVIRRERSGTLRQRKHEPQRIIERIVRWREEASVPHQVGKNAVLTTVGVRR